MNSADDIFMQEAIRQAHIAASHDEVPVGAVIVFKKNIIAKAYNQVELLKDPTAHAEMIALTQATNTISSKWLIDCQMYVTLEPCCMCAGAMILSRIKKVFFSAYDPKSGAAGSIMNVFANQKLNHRVNIAQGSYAEECGLILSEYFENKRRLKKNKDTSNA